MGALVAACSAAPAPPAAEGTITGVLQAVGGPAPGSPRPLPGTIWLHRQKDAGSNQPQTYSMTTGVDGKFSERVSVGVYMLNGRSPLYQAFRADCVAGPITVSPGRTTRVVVSCQEM